MKMALGEYLSSGVFLKLCYNTTISVPNLMLYKNVLKALTFDTNWDIIIGTKSNDRQIWYKRW